MPEREEPRIGVFFCASASALRRSSVLLWASANSLMAEVSFSYSSRATRMSLTLSSTTFTMNS